MEWNISKPGEIILNRTEWIIYVFLVLGSVLSCEEEALEIQMSVCLSQIHDCAADTDNFDSACLL